MQILSDIKELKNKKVKVYMQENEIKKELIGIFKIDNRIYNFLKESQNVNSGFTFTLEFIN